jgi:glutamine---fructose-6-phosphate transaminase (isomerizing)
VFHPNDEAGSGFADLADDLRRIGGCVLVAGGAAKEQGHLPTLTAQQPESDAICLIQSFYGLLAELAACRGKNADQPRHLEKVTRTR